MRSNDSRWALDTQNGHIFSLYIQGLNALDTVDQVKDTVSSSKREIVTFEVRPSEAVKLVGRWYDVSTLKVHNPTSKIGPTVPTMDADGVARMAVLVASPYRDSRHLLLLTCQEIAKIGTVPEVI
jgi:hypothetical protein